MVDRVLEQAQALVQMLTEQGLMSAELKRTPADTRQTLQEQQWQQAELRWLWEVALLVHQQCQEQVLVVLHLGEDGHREQQRLLVEHREHRRPRRVTEQGRQLPRKVVEHQEHRLGWVWLQEQRQPSVGPQQR